MKKITEFFAKYKLAIKWSAGYFVIMYLILLLLFGFNMFSATQWHTLFNARLHGFAGFVFTILMLAALPLYVATTSIIVRTGKPLIKLPGAKKTAEEKSETPAPAADADTAPALPDHIPTELRGAFLRARNTVGRETISVFDMGDVYTAAAPEKTMPQPEPEAENTMPLPDSFDFGDTSESDNAPAFPVFREISFDEPTKKSDKPEPPEISESDELIKYLDEHNIPYKSYGDIVVANDMAIVNHTDPDFWIADNDSWFAAGKQKQSPIKSALNAAEKYNASPAIYLGATNIMDLDNKIIEWTALGVRIIKTPDEVVS
jgi:hypothetical protein